MRASPKDHARLRSRWSDWLDAVNHEITIGYLFHQVWDAVRVALIERYPEVRRHLHQPVLARVCGLPDHAGSAAGGAIIERHPESLHHLIDSIQRNPNVVQELDVHDLGGWCNELASAVAEVSAFADRTIAHRDPRGMIEDVTYAEIKVALDGIATVANRVNVAWRETTVQYDMVTITGDWKEPLRLSLFPPPFGLEGLTWSRSFT